MAHVNFDHAAATPVLPEAYQAMVPYLTEHFGNPQSLHSLGRPAQQALELAREQVAWFINCAPQDVIFTASASESNNLAVKGLALASRGRGRHIVVSAIEHVSVLEPARSLKREGFEITVVGVDRNGVVNPEELARVLRPDTVLVSIQHASNEIGTIQPLEELARVCHEKGIPIHSDGTAAIGRIGVDVAALGVDAYSFSAQSCYGPKGAAVLYLRPKTRIVPLIDGGIQERGRRAGTENVAAIVGMGRAAEITREHLSEWAEHMSLLAKRLTEELPRRIPRLVFTGHPTQRLPGHVSLCVEFVEGEALLLMLDDAGIAAASGSACTARTLKASHVLLAIGLDHAVAQSSLVLTLGKDNTMAEVELLLDKLPPIVERLRAISPLYARFLRGEDPYAVKTGQTGHNEENEG
ncbi:MAG: cysteine desulfurase family protein [candidate division WOR-3 bacterium]